MNGINLASCVLNSRVRVGNDLGTIKFIGEVNCNELWIVEQKLTRNGNRCGSYNFAAFPFNIFCSFPIVMNIRLMIFVWWSLNVVTTRNFVMKLSKHKTFASITWTAHPHTSIGRVCHHTPYLLRAKVFCLFLLIVKFSSLPFLLAETSFGTVVWYRMGWSTSRQTQWLCGWNSIFFMRVRNRIESIKRDDIMQCCFLFALISVNRWLVRWSDRKKWDTLKRSVMQSKTGTFSLPSKTIWILTIFKWSSELRWWNSLESRRHGRSKGNLFWLAVLIVERLKWTFDSFG